MYLFIHSELILTLNGNSPEKKKKNPACPDPRHQKSEKFPFLNKTFPKVLI